MNWFLVSLILWTGAVRQASSSPSSDAAANSIFARASGDGNTVIAIASADNGATAIVIGGGTAIAIGGGAGDRTADPTSAAIATMSGFPSIAATSDTYQTSTTTTESPSKPPTSAITASLSAPVLTVSFFSTATLTETISQAPQLSSPSYTSSTTPPSSSTATTNTSPSANNDLDIGPKIAIGVAVPISLLALSFITGLLIQRRRRRRRTKASKPYELSEEDSRILEKDSRERYAELGSTTLHELRGKDCAAEMYTRVLVAELDG